MEREGGREGGRAMKVKKAMIMLRYEVVMVIMFSRNSTDRWMIW